MLVARLALTVGVNSALSRGRCSLLLVVFLCSALRCEGANVGKGDRGRVLCREKRIGARVRVDLEEKIIFLPSIRQDTDLLASCRALDILPYN